MAKLRDAKKQKKKKSRIIGHAQVFENPHPHDIRYDYPQHLLVSLSLFLLHVVKICADISYAIVSSVITFNNVFPFKRLLSSVLYHPGSEKMALTEQTAPCSGQVVVSKGLISKFHNMTWLKNSPLPDQSVSEEKMGRSKARKPKPTGKSQANVQNLSMGNGGGAAASGTAWKGDKKTGDELFPNARVATVQEQPSEEEQMKWALEQSNKLVYEATLQKVADMDIRNDKDRDRDRDRDYDDYWNKKQSNLPQPEAEKSGTAGKAADTNDNLSEKKTTAGRLGDRPPPGRCVMGRNNNGNVENRVRDIEKAAASTTTNSGVNQDKRFGDNFGRPGRGRASGPREPQRRTSRQDQQQQQSDRYHYYPQERASVVEKSATLKKDDKPEVVESSWKQPVEEKFRLTGFNSRSNRPSPENEDGCSEILASSIGSGDASEKIETLPTCGKICNPPPGFPQPQSINNHENLVIGNLASNPDSQRAYDQLAIHDPLLHRLLVQKHIHDQSSSNNNGQVVLVDSAEIRRYQQQLQDKEEPEEEEVVLVDQSNVYCEDDGPLTDFVDVCFRVPRNTNPSDLIPLAMDVASQYPRCIYYPPRQPPPMVGEHFSTSNTDRGGDNRANTRMGNGSRVPVTPRGTAPSYGVTEPPMAYQSPLGPRYFDNPNENLVPPDYSLLPPRYDATNSRFPVPGAGRRQQQQQLPFPSGNPNLPPVFGRGISRVPGPAFPHHHQYQNFPQRNFNNSHIFPAAYGRDSRPPRPRLEPMPR